MTRLQGWKKEYDRVVARCREKAAEAESLRRTLKLVQAERLRCQREASRRARAAQLETKRRELAAARREARDRRETAALARQVRQLESRLRREQGGVGWRE